MWYRYNKGTADVHSVLIWNQSEGFQKTIVSRFHHGEGEHSNSIIASDAPVAYMQISFPVISGNVVAITAHVQRH